MHVIIWFWIRWNTFNEESFFATTSRSTFGIYIQCPRAHPCSAFLNFSNQFYLLLLSVKPLGYWRLNSFPYKFVLCICDSTQSAHMCRMSFLSSAHSKIQTHFTYEKTINYKRYRRHRQPVCTQKTPHKSIK